MNCNSTENNTGRSTTLHFNIGNVKKALFYNNLRGIGLFIIPCTIENELLGNRMVPAIIDEL